jgi:predicted ATP-grasp superfamily ATP-dependent carboligase
MKGNDMTYETMRKHMREGTLTAAMLQAANDRISAKMDKIIAGDGESKMYSKYSRQLDEIRLIDVNSFQQLVWR